MSQTTYQVILSTDGKHTVIATCEDVAETKAAIDWAQATYDRLVKRYGRKGEQRLQSPQTNGVDAVPVCAVHQVPMERVEGKYGPFWSCHERDAQGNFCAYRPNGK